jgi:maltose O-acetyltransferase
MPRSEREKMLAGELYLASDPELLALRKHARRLTRLFNATTEDDADERRRLLGELLGRSGPRIDIEPPFRCDYGCNIFVGDNLYINFGCVILDCAEVHIGRDVKFGPGVHIYAATHPVDPVQRAAGPELAFPVRIGDRVWVGGGVVIGPGVTIGENSVIGAGSVVVKDIPAGVIAVGNPCRVLRPVG